MGGGKGGGSSASVPDYSALAQQQGLINQQTAQQITSANRADQYDPYGNSITWSQEQTPEYLAAKKTYDDYVANSPAMAAKMGWAPDAVAADMAKYKAAMDAASGQGKWTQTQTLNPQQLAANQKMLSDSNAAGSSFGDILNKYLSSYDPNMKTQDDFSGKSVSDALYGSVMDRTRKTQAQDSDALNTQLRQQGLQPGSEAYNRAMQNLMTSQGDTNALAAQNATLAGANESRQEYQSYLQGRNQPLQELSGMAGVAGGKPYQPTYSNYSQATGYQPADLLGAAGATNAANQSNANSSNSKKSGLLGSATSLGGSYLGSK
jgi:hypothetical protein